MHDSVGAFVPDGLFEIQGAKQGPLTGLTFAAKDIIDVAGRVTGCGNPDWADSHGPAERHAPVVQALLDAGARLVGKTITDELAFSINGQNAHYGTPANVNAPGRIPGGSSSGSAAAVAAGLTELAIGSDTGGSIRVPASYCGLFGLRPSHGRISLEGVMPLAPGFDTLGWFAPNAVLLRRAGEVLLGGSAGDAPAPEGLLIAEDAFDVLEPEARAQLAPWVQRLEARLGAGEPIALGEPGGGLGDWMWRFRLIQGREIWDVHGAWITERQPRFGPDIAARFEWAESIAEEAAAEARRAREDFAQRMHGRLAGGRVVCLPAAPDIAPRTDASPEDVVRNRDRVLCLTSTAGLARLPQITLPLGQLSGCPLGLSLMGGPGSDLSLLAFAESLCGPLSWPPENIGS
jgi:amidase